MIQIEESNPSFESCSDCIYSDDSEETCILRRCIHAVAQLRECYVPKQPTIEPEIVRCKNCKYYHDSDGCFFSTAEIEEDGFCSWAERRTDV